MQELVAASQTTTLYFVLPSEEAEESQEPNKKNSNSENFSYEWRNYE